MVVYILTLRVACDFFRIRVDLEIFKILLGAIIAIREHQTSLISGRGSPWLKFGGPISAHGGENRPKRDIIYQHAFSHTESIIFLQPSRLMRIPLTCFVSGYRGGGMSVFVQGWGIFALFCFQKKIQIFGTTQVKKSAFFTKCSTNSIIAHHPRGGRKWYLQEMFIGYSAICSYLPLGNPPFFDGFPTDLGWGLGSRGRHAIFIPARFQPHGSYHISATLKVNENPS